MAPLAPAAGPSIYTRATKLDRAAHEEITAFIQSRVRADHAVMSVTVDKVA